MANIPLPLSSPKSPRQPALLQHHTHHHHHNHHNHHHHSTTPPITSLIKTLILEPNNFSPDSAQRICLDIFNQHATPAQISAFIVALRLHSLDKKPEFVHACADALRQVALPLDLSSYPELASEIVDIVGTGGDGHDTFNVSTAAAIVAAGAGCKVAKHGNRASSSQTGSADLLEAIGCKIEHFSSNDVASTLEAGNFCFLFATKYHPALRIVSAIRKEIGIPSIFNLLGPMINPARPRRIVVGVHSPNLGSLMVEALKLSGVERAMVVCGADGLDEITPAGETRVWNLYPDGTVAETMLHPRDFGLPTRPLTSVRGGHPARNASLLREILNSNGVSFFNPTASDIEPSGASAEEKIATLDFVLMNAAALIVVAGKAEGYAEAVELARESLASGNARAALDAYAQQTLREYLESMKSGVQD